MKDYDYSDAFEKNLIPINCVDNFKDFDTLTSQLNCIYVADTDSTLDVEAIINHHFVSGVLELEVTYTTGRKIRNRE